MKVLLCRAYGSHTFSKELKNILLRKKFPENRTGAVINHLEKQGEVVTRGDDGYWIKADEEFYFVAEVDTNRPWTILEYDGSEYIQYLDYKVIHKDLNYCEFIN